MARAHGRAFACWLLDRMASHENAAQTLVCSATMPPPRPRCNVRGAGEMAVATCSAARLQASDRFSNRLKLKDDDGDMPVCTLLVDLIATVLAGEERPQALALLGSRLPCLYQPYFRPQLDLCLRVSTKIEIPRGVVLLPGIGRNHNNGFAFPITAS